MKSSRTGTNLVSVILLMLWGGVMLYFYASGRLAHYLPPDGIFRPMVLVGGIGLMVMGLFNLATLGSKEGSCCDDGGSGCGHDHNHDHDHDHKHDHGAHAHKAGGGCCDHGHDHHHEPRQEAAATAPEAAAPTGHSHKEGSGCCGHGHQHEHEHAHDHSHGGDDHSGHSHGILEESGAIGKIVVIFLLAVPVTYAAIRTPDKYSANAVINKGLYNPNYGEGGAAEQFSLKKEARSTNATAAGAPPAPASTASLTSPDAPPPGMAPPTPGSPGEIVPPVNPEELARQAQKAGAEAKSYGHFTLADLEAQVPRSKEGNFMLEVPEIYYTAGDKEVQSVLNGQPVETIAQVMPEKVNNPHGTRVRIFRLQVQCCAADARPYSIPVEFGATPPEFKEMSWVKVVGKVFYKQEGTQTVPVVEATSMKETAEPDSKMVY